MRVAVTLGAFQPQAVSKAGGFEDDAAILRAFYTAATVKVDGGKFLVKADAGAVNKKVRQSVAHPRSGDEILKKGRRVKVEQLEELRTARDVEDEMGANSVAVGNSVLDLIIKRPGLAHRKMLRAAFGEKVRLIVRDDRHVHTKWLDPCRVLVDVGAGHA
jgi:hypothetical protein